MAAHEPVAAYRGGRVRRDFSRAELGEPIDRSREEPQNHDRAGDDTAQIWGHGASSLYLAQHYAQEIDPA
ncbi:MAG: hypothetical protein OER92_03410, partial [Alphaproteobacteria bacterium]|nr:hypothetical protein [Alphaproteobacteria bacterium]